ncbi:MAG: hypothetical protein ACK4K0_08225 [Flavobacteriales bacterium]
MKKIIYIPLFFVALTTGVVFAQKEKKVSPEESQQEMLETLRKDARAALKPYRYDASKTTIFSYKQFDYVKEVEIALSNSAEYIFSVNANGVQHDKITLLVYDKPEGAKGRVLLYEKKNVGGNNFTFKSDELLEKMKEDRKAKGVDQTVIDRMYLKNVYVDFVIPAVEKEVEADKKGEVVVVKKGAVVIAVGYDNI